MEAALTSQAVGFKADVDSTRSAAEADMRVSREEIKAPPAQNA